MLRTTEAFTCLWFVVVLLDASKPRSSYPHERTGNLHASSAGIRSAGGYANQIAEACGRGLNQRPYRNAQVRESRAETYPQASQ